MHSEQSTLSSTRAEWVVQKRQVQGPSGVLSWQRLSSAEGHAWHGLRAEWLAILALR